MTQTNVLVIIKMGKGVIFMKKERLINLAGILCFYLVLILGVIALNERMEVIETEERIAAFGN